MIDLHCHLLPRLDDGAESWEETMDMVRLAEEDGVRAIVCTPHVPNTNGRGSDELDEFVHHIAAGVTALRRRIERSGLNMRVGFGGEIPFGVPIEYFGRFSINSTRYVLTELPHDYLPKEASQFIFELVTAGLIPIIAHPERNRDIIKRPKRLTALLRAGAIAQITGDSLLGRFGERAEACAEYLLKAGQVSIIASDAHSSHRRRPELSKAVVAASRLTGWEAAYRLVGQNPQAVLRGDVLSPPV